jgi:trehalose 6-phosphate synthase
VSVVSNRGPFRFTREPDGTFSAQRGAGGVVSALLPLLASREDATWVAAAIDDDDVAATAAGAPPPQPGVHARLLPLDPTSNGCTDVISNATLWFLHHVVRPPRRPRFDRRFREAGRVRRGEPRVHRRGTDVA